MQETLKENASCESGAQPDVVFRYLMKNPFVYEEDYPYVDETYKNLTHTCNKDIIASSGVQ